MEAQEILKSFLDYVHSEKAYRTYHKDNNGCLTSSAYSGKSIIKVCEDRNYEIPKIEKLKGWQSEFVIWVGNFGIGMDCHPVKCL